MFEFNLYAILQALAWTVVIVAAVPCLSGAFLKTASHAWRQIQREQEAERKARADERIDAAFLASHPRYRSALTKGAVR